MKNKTRKIKYFLTKTYNKDKTVPFAWTNTIYHLLDESDINQLHKYMKEKRIY